ncbi:MAG: hypothetical protein JWM30_2407 [Burkholderia sp.]|nr:hypothetical protein [Burkholderia sp.]
MSVFNLLPERRLGSIVFVFVIEVGIVFVLEGKKVALCFFHGLEGRHNFKHIGNKQEAAKLPACTGDGNAAAPLVNRSCGVEYDPYGRDADQGSKAEVKNDVSDVVICGNRKPLLQFLGNGKISVLIGTEIKYAVCGVCVNAHGESLSKLHCNCW